MRVRMATSCSLGVLAIALPAVFGQAIWPSNLATRHNLEGTALPPPPAPVPIDFVPEFSFTVRVSRVPPCGGRGRAGRPACVCLSELVQLESVVPS